jgi:hypothetical protein
MSDLQTAVRMSLNPKVDAPPEPFSALSRDALLTVYSFLDLRTLRETVRACSLLAWDLRVRAMPRGLRIQLRLLETSSRRCSTWTSSAVLRESVYCGMSPA